MKLEFTKEQYWHLMRAVYIADWMTNAVTTKDSEVDKEIKSLEKYIYSFAKEMGYGKYIDTNDEENSHEANSNLDDEPTIRKLIERYDEFTSWEEVAGWLGERDFHQKYEDDEIAKMSREDRFLKLMECQIVWEEEFENNGISRININDMDNMLKQWHKVKDGLIKSDKKVYFHEREVWWCSIGRNIGFEQNGKGEEFTRPIIIVKRLSLDTCLIVPLTTSKKRKNLFPLGNLVDEKEETYAMVEQIRLIDAKRLGKKVGVLNSDIYSKMINFIKKTNFK
ncbi:MAG: type II toxin-antitoxin system PemK/MazF family toxin [Candidatus Paceibacterota bacterium]|jgi:mRNA interferase MazF